MSEKKEVSVLKFVGILGAIMLITFGSFQNFWRTAKVLGRRLMEG